VRRSLENLDYNRILAMLSVGLSGFMLPKVPEEVFYADPPKNKFGGSTNGFYDRQILG
jgi:hypothetical protein